MLSHISWAGYWSVTALLITGWYLYLGATTFKNDIIAFFNLRKKALPEPNGGLFSASGFNQKSVAEPEPEFAAAISIAQEPSYDEIDELIERVKSATVECVEQELGKTQLSQSLHKIVKDYPDLIDSPYRPSIDEFIITECAEQTGIRFTEAEAQSLWN